MSLGALSLEINCYLCYLVFSVFHWTFLIERWDKEAIINVISPPFHKFATPLKNFQSLALFLFSLWFWLLICSLNLSIMKFALYKKMSLYFVAKSFNNFHIDHSCKFSKKSLWINENFIVTLFRWNLYI